MLCKERVPALIGHTQDKMAIVGTLCPNVEKYGIKSKFWPRMIAQAYSTQKEVPIPKMQSYWSQLKKEWPF